MYASFSVDSLFNFLTCTFQRPSKRSILLYFYNKKIRDEIIHNVTMGTVKSKRKSLLQFLGTAVIIINRYSEKCLSILETDNFTKLANDSVNTIENKIRRSIQKIRLKLTK